MGSRGSDFQGVGVGESLEIFIICDLESENGH